MKERRETCSQSSRSGAADAQPTVSRSRPRRARKALRAPLAPAGQGCSPAVAPFRPPCGPGDVFEKKTRGPPNGAVHNPENGEHPMELMMVDPRALKENPDQMRRSKSSPAGRCACCWHRSRPSASCSRRSILPARDGGNGYVIHFGHRRVAQAIAAELAEIRVLVADPDADHDAMRALVENVAREPLNPSTSGARSSVWCALGWTEESIALALALPVRQVRKLRLLANVLPAMLDQMAKGDMPGEPQLRVIAAASIDEQSEVWKKYKPRKADPQVSWHDVARALTEARMYAAPRELR